MAVYAKKVTEAAAKPVKEKVEKVKKPRTEKQLAADARMAENRKKKIEMKPVEKVAKKKVEKKAEKKVLEVKSVPLPKKDAIVVPKKLERPPAWFESYVQGRAKDENKEGNVKEIKTERKAESALKWADPETRKVVNRVDGHMDKMYRKGLFDGRYDVLPIMCGAKKIY